MTIGQRVREKRIAHGFSQENLAHAAGLSWGAIQRLEAGKIVDPHYSTLEGIAHTLGTTIAELVGEKEPVPLDKAPGEAGLADVHKLLSDARQREDWREAVDNWRHFRSGAKESLREQLSRWEAARDQGISYEGRREFLDIVGWILDGAISVSRKLLQNLAEGLDRMAEPRPEGTLNPYWREYQEADTLYHELFEMVGEAGLSVRLKKTDQALGQADQALAEWQHEIVPPAA